MKIAIITGASSGMGQEFVRELDANEDFDEIWVVARRRERLEELVSQTRAKLKPVPSDLTKRESIDNIAAMLEAEKPDVAVLVNASGFGRFGRFDELTLNEQYEMIDLNAGALVGVTYTVLPYMKNGGRIYEICSLSSFQPVPYMDIYASTKAFVLSFSCALNRELKGRGIKVMAVCPGWVKTEFFNRASTDNTVTYYNKYFTAPQVVRRALQDMKNGKDVSVCGASVRFQVFLTKLLPHRFVMNVWCRQQNKIT